MSNDTETRQHAILLHRRTLGRLPWSRFCRQAEQLYAWMQERYGADVDFTVEVDGDSFQLRPGWDSHQVVTLLRVIPGPLWESRANDRGRLSIPVELTDDERGLASRFLESVMMLMQIQFPDRVTIGSRNGFPDWQDALYTVMSAVYPGPWTGENIARAS